MYQDQISEHKKKLLEYLEKECEQQHSTNAEITNRAGITATLLAGVSFLTLDNEKIQQTLLISNTHFTLSAALVLSALFVLSFIALTVVLLYRRDFLIIPYDLELGKVYGDSNQQPEGEFYKYYSLRLYHIWKKNKQVLENKARLFNLSLIIEILAAFVYIYSLNK